MCQGEHTAFPGIAQRNRDRFCKDSIFSLRVDKSDYDIPNFSERFLMDFVNCVFEGMPVLALWIGILMANQILIDNIYCRDTCLDKRVVVIVYWRGFLKNEMLRRNLSPNVPELRNDFRSGLERIFFLVKPFQVNGLQIDLRQS